MLLLRLSTLRKVVRTCLHATSLLPHSALCKVVLYHHKLLLCCIGSCTAKELKYRVKYWLSVLFFLTLGLAYPLHHNACPLNVFTLNESTPHKNQVNSLKPICSFDNLKRWRKNDLQFIGAVEWLSNSETFLKIGSHLEWINFCIRLLCHCEHFPKCNTKWPLETRKNRKLFTPEQNYLH